MSDQHPDDNQGNPIRGSFEVTYRPDPNRYGYPSKKRDDHRRKCPWVELAALVIQLLLLIMTGVIAWIYYGQLAEMKKQVEQSAEHFKLAQRPWVQVKPPEIDKIDFTKDYVNIEFRLTFKNVGITPAIGAIPVTLFIGLLDGIEESESKRKTLCDPLRKAAEIDLEAFTIFPNETVERPFAKSFEANPFLMRDAPDRAKVYPVIVGCIDYRSSLEPDEHRQTPLWFEIRPLSKDRMRGADLPLRISRGESLDPENLVIQPLSMFTTAIAD